MNRNYHYFISYKYVIKPINFRVGQSPIWGFGRGDYYTETIMDMDSITKIEKDIETKNNYDTVLVDNYILLKE
jgi:hypothetical protein